ncbi:DUF6368 family protein [Streptomyces sp. NRRL S-813]|uniref:DUF6368 family protein n=1 Tax=Streptomyces sp. NRRL S-813 TaxID=1463919 RepID=UPI003B63D62F
MPHGRPCGCRHPGRPHDGSHGEKGSAGPCWLLGTAEFLRAWVGHPAFRLVK